jgi:hypothetical protein
MTATMSVPSFGPVPPLVFEHDCPEVGFFKCAVVTGQFSNPNFSVLQQGLEDGLWDALIAIRSAKVASEASVRVKAAEVCCFRKISTFKFSV